MGNAESAAFPYTLQDQVQSYHSTIGWTLHRGIQTSSGDQVSIFAFDKIKNSSKVDCARNGMAVLRQLRHPFVLKYISCVEQSNMIYVVTEPITPLTIPFKPQSDDPVNAFATNQKPSLNGSGSGGELTSKGSSTSYNSHDTTTANATKTSVLTSSSLDLHLKPLKTDSPESIQLLLSAGIYQIYNSIEFLNMRAGMVHGNINPTSIFIAQNGDWKLGGFDLAFKSNPSSSLASAGPSTPSSSSSSSSPTQQQSSNDFLDFDSPQSTTVATTPRSSTPHSPQHSPQATTPTTLGHISLAYRSHYSSQDRSYIAPDVLSNSWKKLENYPIYTIDSYSMGQLLRQLVAPRPKDGQAVSGSGQSIPALLLPEFRLYFPNATSATSQNNDTMTPLLDLPQHSRMLQSTYFNNHVISALVFLDEIHIKSTEEKTAFFTQFSTIYTMFPTSILRNRIIPQLILSFEVISPKTAGSSFPGILNSTFAVSKVCLPIDEYNKTIVPLIKKLFQSPDLDIRMSLLHSLKEFAQFLTIDMVFHDILPTIVVGIYDPNPMVRELTIIGMISFLPHFLRVKNGEFDTAFNNIAIISNKVAYDAYNYATNTISLVSNYLGYQNQPDGGTIQQQQQQQQYQNEQQSGQQGNSGANMGSLSSNQMNQAGTTSTSSSSSSSSSSNATTTTSTNPNAQKAITTQSNPHLFTLPSLYLSQIIFPALINHFPNEILPQVRSSILLTSTALAQLLPPTSQETILLTIYAKGMKDSVQNVRQTALDGLIISLLTSSFTIFTLCNKIIPFTCPFICESKDKDIAIRSVFVLQYSLYKIQRHYGLNTGGSAGGANIGIGLDKDATANNTNMVTILQSYPNRYPMLQLDMTHLGQQVQIATSSSPGNNPPTTTQAQQSTPFSSPPTTTSVISSNAPNTTFSLPTAATRQVNTTGSGNKPMDQDDQMKAMFPDLVQPTKSSNNNTSNNNTSNNNSSHPNNNNRDGNSVDEMFGPRGSGNNNTTNNNNNNKKSMKPLQRPTQQQSLDLDFGELDTTQQQQTNPRQLQQQQPQSKPQSKSQQTPSKSQQPQPQLDIFDAFSASNTTNNVTTPTAPVSTSNNPSDDWSQFM